MLPKTAEEPPLWGGSVSRGPEARARADAAQPPPLGELANRRGYWSLILFLVLFVLSMFAEFLANDRPILVRYKGELLAPVLFDYPESSSAASCR